MDIFGRISNLLEADDFSLYEIIHKKVTFHINCILQEYCNKNEHKITQV